MLRYVAQRLVLSAPVFFSVVSIVFVIVRVSPGDPAQAALGDYASKEAVEALRTRLGLDAPLPIQYVRFLGDLVRGDLGVSMINGTPIRDQVAYNLPFTVELTAAALVIGILLGLPVGVATAVDRNRAPDYVCRILSLTGLSVPAFYLGILLSLLFAVQLKWLPAIGGGDPATPVDLIGYLVLPALTWAWS
jgi:ABC-type dipeptide/oligopeptide/nickel transport system permease component